MTMWGNELQCDAQSVHKLQYEHKYIFLIFHTLALMIINNK